MKQTIKAIFVALFISTLLLSCATSQAKKTNPTGLKEQTRTEVITVTGGDIRGIINKDGNVEIFAGVPLQHRLLETFAGRNLRMFCHGRAFLKQIILLQWQCRSKMALYIISFLMHIHIQKKVEPMAVL